MYVKARVTPGAKRESVREVKEGLLDISVTAPAAQNLANRRVIALVALHYRVSVTEVRILSGHRARSKMLSVSND